MATSKKAPPASASQVAPAAVRPVVTKPKAGANAVAAPQLAAAPVAKKAALKAAAKATTKATAKTGLQIQTAAKAEASVAKVMDVAAKAPVAKPKAAAKKVGKVEGPAIDQAQRANYIEVAAYYIAQRRGFTPGDPDQDYLNAAAEVDQLIAAGHFSK